MKKILVLSAALLGFAAPAIADTVSVCPSLDVAKTTVRDAMVFMDEDLVGRNCAGEVDVSALSGADILYFFEAVGERIEFVDAGNGQVALVPDIAFGSY